MAERDFLEKMIDKRTARNPEFPRLLDAARRRRELLRSLAEQREQQERSQTAIAAAMDTSQSFIARLETTAGDAKISTVDRYAESLGFTVQYHLIPTGEAANIPPVVVRAAGRQQAKPRRQVSASASAR
jgi:transcriptional regulator with XRE-family HTH domain